MNSLSVLFNNLYLTKISEGDGPASCADKKRVIVLVQNQNLPVENSIYMVINSFHYKD